MIDSASLLLALADHDPRICFAFNLISKNFIYVNPAFKSFFQLKTAEVSPKTVLEMVWPENLDLLKEIFKTLKPGEFKRNIELGATLPNGKEKFLRLNLLFQVENEVPTLVGFIEDISDYKAYSEKFDEFYIKKKDILNVISHDLASPLGSIQNLSALLSRKTKLLEDKEIKTWISLIGELSKKSVLTVQEFVKQEFKDTDGSVRAEKE